MGNRNKGTFVTLFEGVFLSFHTAPISLNNCLCSVIHYSLVLAVFLILLSHFITCILFLGSN